MWTEVEPSQFPWEQEALSFLKAGLPAHEPYRAWSNFEFIAENGSINEVDALIVTTRGLFLVEIKSHPGVITGDQTLWSWTRPNGSKSSFDNPYLLANRKAKKLKSLLERQKAFRNEQVPFVIPLVFLSSPDLDCRLHVQGRAHVTARDDLQAKTNFAVPPGVIRTLKDPSTANIVGTAINTPTSKRIAEGLAQLGIRASSKYRRLGEWQLGALLDEGEGWQDFEATHPVARSKRRVRIYLARRAHTAEEADQLRRAAERELRLLEGVKHPGIAQPIEIQQHEYGPALRFELVTGEERLDLWAEQHLASLDLYSRIEMVRDLAEALDYAHRHQLSHRALVPRNVLVRPPLAVPGVNPSTRPRLVISNWQFATRAPSTQLSRFGATAVDPTEQMSPADVVYLAPEIGSAAEPDGERADMFSLGALAYLLLSGQAPAPSVAERTLVLQNHDRLRLEVAFDGAPQRLVDLVCWATQAAADQRFASMQDVLKELDDALDELTTAETDTAVDPLTANKGDLLDRGWRVRRRLGSGSTATALLVERDGAVEVLKVALDEANAPRLDSEKRALDRLRHYGIVECHGIERVGGRTALRLAPAFDVRSDSDDEGQTLAERLLDQGKLGLDLLERFGDDLLEVVGFLESEGIAHRDIKPDNLGVRMRGKNNELHLVLFDFSLSAAPVEHVRAGTPRYLDPFLEERRPPRWDIAAERYAAAVTLYQMATGTLPRWGDGTSDPLMLHDQLPRLDGELLDPTIRDDLLAFFGRALQRDPLKRYDTARDMRVAWRSVFERATRTTDANEPLLSDDDERLASVASADTPIAELGLSLGARNLLEQRGIATAGDLVLMPLHDLSTIRGVGHRLRKELRAAARRLAPYVNAVPDVEDARSIDAIVHTCLPRGSSAVVETDLPPTEALLALDDDSAATWPTLVAVATRFGLDRTAADELLDRARKRWLKNTALTAVRDDVAALLDASGGIATGDEVALLLLAQRGSSKTGADRLRRGRAVVRAAVEAEDGRNVTRFTFRRLGTTIVLAAHGGQSDAQELTDYASSLGPIADELAMSDPLLAPGAVLDRLRAVAPPFGLEPLSDTRLVRLAAAASRTAAVSSRLELYPRGMAGDRALSLARAAALLGVGTLSEEQVRDRVRARFAEAADLPGRPELDAMLDRLVGLEWFSDRVTAQSGYRVPPPKQAPSSTVFGRGGTRYRTGTSTVVPDEQVQRARDAEDRLQRSIGGGGFLVLTVRPGLLLRAERALREQFSVEVLDAEATLIGEMRRITTERRVRWDAAVLATDADGPAGANWSRLRQIVTSAADATEAAILARRDVLITRPGLLARYDVLTPMVDRLRNRTTVTVDRQQTLRTAWLLVAADDPAALPRVDGAVVPILNAGEWMALPEAWLDNKHETEAGAA